MRVFIALTLSALFALPAAAKGFYVGTYGGWNNADVISSPFVDANDGFVLGGVAGTTIDAIPGLRVEADMAFRQNEVEIFGGKLNADLDTFTFLANAVYDLPFTVGPLHPYLLAGAGYGHSELTLENIALAKLEASGLAWQLGAGLNTQVADGVILGLGYRYLQATEITVFGTELSDGSNHSVLATINFTF